MTVLPNDIQVFESFASAFRETHYLLPVRTHEAVKQFFLVALIGSIGLAVIPFVFSIFFAIVGSEVEFEFWLIMVLMPIGFFGAFLYPLALALLLYGAFCRWGRTEIICTPDRISVRDRLGLLRWTRRLPVAGLKGFHVQSGTLKFGANNRTSPGEEIRSVGVLSADYTTGKNKAICSGYASGWLASLAQELTRRLGIVDAEGQPLVVTQTSTDPTVIQRRTEQPTTSDARVQVQGDTLVIEHPAKGFWRGVPGFFKLFGLFWNGFMVIWTLVFIPALLAGEVKWNDGPEKTSIWFGLLFCVPFYLVGFGFLVYFYAASIYAARWTIRADDLELWERSLFGERTQSWPRSELSSIQVITRQNNDEDKTWTTFLQIATTTDESTEHFSHRDKAELEWLATTLSKALGL
jgi:hypothetical protein